jgi:hypothetical protein
VGVSSADRATCAIEMPDDMHTTDADVWSAVRRLVNQAPSLSDLRSHGLHLLAARTWREEGRAVPDDLALQEMFAIGQLRVGGEMLSTVASIIDQEIIALKGMAVAFYYPDPALRPFGDLDLLVADPARAQRQLIAAGLRPVAGFGEGFFDGHHHLHPLELPGRSTVKVEIHSRAPWVHWCPSPSFGELRASARPAPIPGVWFPDRAEHALILSCHSWHSLPLRRILDLIDIALVGEAAGPDVLASLARRRRVSRLWSMTQAVSDALLHGGREPLPLRLWARDLRAVRECSLIERHMRSWFAPFSVRAPHAAAAEALRAVALDLRPTGGEAWGEKLGRTRQGLQHPLRPIGDHDKDLGPAARRLRPRHGRSAGPIDESADLPVVSGSIGAGPGEHQRL